MKEHMTDQTTHNDRFASGIFKNDGSETRADVLRIKHRFGTAYGLAIGLAYAFATWGPDAMILSSAHMLYPWIKLILGGTLCGLVGAFAGWVTGRFERWYVSIPAWVGLAVFFSWILIILPLQLNPFITSLLSPQISKFIEYLSFSELLPRFLVAFSWIILFVLIVGVLQIPFIEPAAFSPSLFGKIAPFFVGIFIILINGFVTDSLNNAPLRAAVVAMDHSIQFVVDNKGVQVDPAVSRVNHAGSLRAIKDLISEDRKITIGGYDPLLGEIHLIVQFDGLLADCMVIYEQPSNCRQIDLH